MSTVIHSSVPKTSKLRMGEPIDTVVLGCLKPSRKRIVPRHETTIYGASDVLYMCFCMFPRSYQES